MNILCKYENANLITQKSMCDALEARAIAGEIFDPSDDKIWG